MATEDRRINGWGTGDRSIVLEARGVVEPGTVVKVNGRVVEVGPDGTFGCTARPHGDDHQIAVKAERDGNRKVAVRRFRLRQ